MNKEKLEKEIAYINALQAIERLKDFFDTENGMINMAESCVEDVGKQLGVIK